MTTTSIRVLEYQAISTVIESEHPPESQTKVAPLTLGGSFDNEISSCVYAAKASEEASCMELNFIVDTGSELASLIPPGPSKYGNPGGIEEHYHNVVLDRLTDNGHPVMMSKARVAKIMEEVFTSMTTVSNFIYDDWEKQYAA